jgi:alcohol dehydrogenase (cytochrome c)
MSKAAKRKVVMHFSRGGFLYVIDRTNGDLLSAEPFENGKLGDAG